MGSLSSDHPVSTEAITQRHNPPKPQTTLMRENLKSFPVKISDCACERRGPSDRAAEQSECVCVSKHIAATRALVRVCNGENLCSLQSRRLWLYLVIAAQKACPPTLSMSNRKANMHRSRYFYGTLIINRRTLT